MVTASTHLGAKIKTVEQLARIAGQQRAVFFPNWARPMPASAVLNMQARIVLRLLKAGMWAYQKGTK